MELQLFIYKNLAIHFYYSKESVKNNLVRLKNFYLYFPGLPQIKNREFFIDKVNKDTAFFFVYHYGSWLSGKKFTPENCKKSVEVAIELTKQKKAIKTFDNKLIKWQYQNLNIIGSSFVGNPILQAKIKKKDVKKIFLFAPLIYLHRSEVKRHLTVTKVINFYNLNRSFLQFLRRGYKFILKGIAQSCWDRYFNGKNKNTIVKVPDDFPFIYIFHGDRDSQIPIESSIYFQKNFKENSKIIIKKGAGHKIADLLDIQQLKKC